MSKTKANFREARQINIKYGLVKNGRDSIYLRGGQLFGTKNHLGSFDELSGGRSAPLHLHGTTHQNSPWAAGGKEGETVFGSDGQVRLRSQVRLGSWG